MLALLIPVMLGLVGVALDMGNLYLAKHRLQIATDAGALAGALELPYDPDISNGRVVAAANNGVTTNYPEATVSSVIPGTEIRSVTVKASVKVDMILMQVMDFFSKTITAEASAGFNNIEVVLVIDNSGSMKGTPISQVKSASNNLVDLIIPTGSSPGSKIGLVPFRGKVHLPEGYDGLPDGCRNADGSLNEGIHEDFMDDYWNLPYKYRKRISLDSCSNIPHVHPLSTNKNSIQSAINQQDASGAASGTAIAEGIKWGRHVLTPEAPFTEGDEPDKYRKVMILLTDGDTEDGECGGSYKAYYRPNNYWTNAHYGMGDDTTHCDNGGKMNALMLQEAQLAKDADIEIFAIRYGSSDSTDVNLMKQVASSRDGTDDHYFDAPSAYDIDDVFKKIGKQLGWRLLH